MDGENEVGPGPGPGVNIGHQGNARNYAGVFRRNIAFIVMIVVVAFLIKEKKVFNFDISKEVHKTVIALEDYIPGLTKFGEYFHKPKSQEKTQEKTREGKKDLHSDTSQETLKLMTDDDIMYKEGGKLYLVILGHVFDVSDGANYYGKGGNYFGFIGKDGTKAFISGQFDDKGLTSDLTDLEADGFIGIDTWIKFYKDHKTYKHIGYHIGTFFDSAGKETKAMEFYHKSLKAAKVDAKKDEDLKNQFPLCNVEWKAATGSRLWCSGQSGGVNREWDGYPHQFREQNKHVRCACVHPDRFDDPRVKPYDNCDENGENCFLPPTKEKKK